MYHTNLFLLILIGLFTTLLLALKCFIIWKYRYWQKRRIPYLKPSFPFGNVSNPLLLKGKGGVVVGQLYKEMKKRGWKHGGIFVFTSPVYLPTDLDYIKNILTKDFDYFVDHGYYVNEKKDPVSSHLLTLSGTKWRTLRKKLNPTFTSSKMKTMFHTASFCVENLMEKIETDFKFNKTMCINDTFISFTTNIICSCALGIEDNIFKEEGIPFKFYIKKCISWSKVKYFVQILSMMFSRFAKFLNVRTTPKDVSDFFINFATDIVRYRKNNNYIRKDFMQLLIDLKDNGSLTIPEIAAQCLLFVVAGLESTSATMSFALYELSKQQDIQDKLREEINLVLANYENKLTYEAVSKMEFLDQIIAETLRKYPPLYYLNRQCTKDYKMPDENVIIEKGTFVVIPLYGIHYDEELYPDPKTFDPERFNKDNRSVRHPYAYLAFGEGPRLCIGKRFGLMVIKMGLASLLNKYKFTLNGRTNEPLALRTDTVVLSPKDQIWLDLVQV